MTKPELLAPAGNMDSLKAAIEAGCDAAYLGGYMFGARSYAGNFSNEEIIIAVKYAHLYGVKIYVTTNTIVYENETQEFIDYIDFLHKNNVDAIIIQDVGMMDLIRNMYPNFEVHASTQMHIHNLEGLSLVQKLGLKRAVLARETSIDTIKKIKQNSKIELECFVHGALCVSYSGQCLMSSMIGGRSGNRGSCAGCCRQKYDLISNNNKVNEEEYLLSMKDLNTLEHISKLIESGIDSFKIEGRMKSPEYVYLVVSLYRKAIDSYFKNKKIEIDFETIKSLKKVFNRDFTKGFILNENNNFILNHFRSNHLGVNIGTVVKYQSGKLYVQLSDNLNIGDGIRIITPKEDVGFNVTTMFKDKQKLKKAFKDDIIEILYDEVIPPHSIVLKTTDIEEIKRIHNLISENKRKVKIQMTLSLQVDKPAYLVITDGTNVVNASGPLVSKAINYPITLDQVTTQLGKLGSSVYSCSDFKIDMDNNIYINIKDLNELRRTTIEQLNEKRLYTIPYEKKVYQKKVPNFNLEHNLNVSINTLEQYKQIKRSNIKEIYVDESLYPEINDSRLILKLPRVINEYKEYNQQLLVGEIGSLEKYNEVYTDWSFNVTNSYSVAFLHNLGVKKVTLSYELNNGQIDDLINSYVARYNSNPNLELIIYSRVPVMISKVNLFKYFDVDNNDNYLKDRFNNLYPIKIVNNLMVVYDYKTKILTDYNNKISNIRIELFDEINIDKIITTYKTL